MDQQTCQSCGVVLFHLLTSNMTSILKSYMINYGGALLQKFLLHNQRKLPGEGTLSDGAQVDFILGDINCRFIGAGHP